MADDVQANASTTQGAVFRAFNDGTRDWPANIVSWITGGSAGAWTIQYADPTHGLPVSVLGTVPVSGTFWQATQPVSAASLPLPTGAATAAKQPALGTAGTASADVLTVQGIAAMTPLKVDGSGVTQPVSGTLTANQGGAWSITVGAALPAGTNVIGGVELVDSAGVNKASISAAGALKVDGSAATQPVSGTVTANLGTLNGVALDATLTGGSQKAVPVAATTGGATPTRVLSAGAANQDSTIVKASAGQVYSVAAFNTNAAARYLKLYDKATGPTSADAPVQTYLIPGNASGAGLTLALPVGMNFASGISLRITTGMADNDTGAAAVGDVAVSLTYK